MEKFNQKVEELDRKHIKGDVYKNFVSFAIATLDLKSLPSILLSKDTKKVKEMKSMAYYAPGQNKIWIYTKNRNTADILRSLAHELVHAKQKETLDRAIDGSTGSEDENEANAQAGVLLRKYGKMHSDIYE